jgi:Right handed beta helix region
VGRVVLLLAALALAGASAAAAKPRAITVRNATGFAHAAAKLRRSGGTIVLRPGAYASLILGPRGSSPLRIVGAGGVRVGRFELFRTRSVSISNLRIGPVAGDAKLELDGASNIDLDHITVTAQGTSNSTTIFVASAYGVHIRNSTFTHCGDRSPDFANCITLNRGAHSVVIESNSFHDCHGCDFIHGRFGSRLTIRNNRFDRALPCHHITSYRCRHNDLVQLFAGRWLRVERNHFGVYRAGGAQLYLTDDVDHATVVDNVFVGTDPKLPGYRARVAIVLGAKGSKRLPYYAKVVNNTILTGYRRRDGYLGSIRMSSAYGSVRLWKRPIIANNVIALLGSRWPVCATAQQFLANVVITGINCQQDGYVGDAGLDAAGRPNAESVVIGAANRDLAPPLDFTGRRRDADPDVGAYELR